MKNLKINLFSILLLMLSLSVLLIGCAKEEPEEVIDGSQIGLTTEEPEPVPQEVPEEVVEEVVDTPPEEGMVRSNLTNEWIDAELSNQRPLAVMYPTDKAAQPQYGIGNADVMYECMEEGSISRQMAIIQDWHGLEKIGNIRSCRLYYLYLACEWDPILVHFGGVYYMRERILEGDITNISGTYSDGTPETTAPGNSAFYRPAEITTVHNAFVNSETLEKAIEKLDYPTEFRDEFYQAEHFQFAPVGTTSDLTTLEGITPINATKVDFKDVYPYSQSHLVYNEEDNLYYKYLHGNAQIDQLTGNQLTFTNIIVQNTYYEYAPDNKYLVFQMHDTTRDGYFITGGKAIHVTWEKTADYGPTRYYDDNGDEIVLNTGKTFIAIAQHDTKAIIE